MYAAGIEQMQPVLMPAGNAYVRGVESLFVCDDGNYIAIMYGVSEKLCVGYRIFGNIAIALATDALLQLLIPGSHSLWETSIL